MFIFVFCINIFVAEHLHGEKPKLTIIFIVDQFAYHYVPKIKPYLSGGLHELFENGFFYKNAHMPHSTPTTSCGHVTISTGTYPKTHGIIGNRIADKSGNMYRYEMTKYNKKSAVFSPSSTYNYSKSAERILVDNLSDQFVLHSQPGNEKQAFAISHKSKAAIGTAGKLGKAIWFDTKGRRFTSSKAYFEELPEWLVSFNKKYLTPKIPEALVWKPFFPKNHAAYNFHAVKNYNFAAHPFPLINTPFKSIKNIPDARKTISKGDYSELYIKTPSANQHLLDLARTCLDNNFFDKKSSKKVSPSAKASPSANDSFLLWISLSPLDPLGHYYGPESTEVFDLIYHLDWQIKNFMKYVHSKISPKDVLYVLTADHGVMPIVELTKKKGLLNACRIEERPLIRSLNKHILKKYRIKNLVSCYRNGSLYLNRKILRKLPLKKQKDILSSLKTQLKNIPAIREAWTFEELQKLQVKKGSIDSFFKNQTHKERSGEIICKCDPYCVITSYLRGTVHRTPYEYDTHVPLVIYRKGFLEKKMFSKKVFSTRIANTVAKILDISGPSASTSKPLPGI